MEKKESLKEKVFRGLEEEFWTEKRLAERIVGWFRDAPARKLRKKLAE